MTTILSDLLANITERGLSILHAARPDRGAGTPDEVLEMCDYLLSSRGEASGIAVANEVLGAYAALPAEARGAFFAGLASRFGVDLAGTADAVRGFQRSPGQQTATALHFAAEPLRQELIRRLNRAPGGTAALVAMRADLLALIDAGEAEYELVDQDFRHLLASWFNRGFLTLTRIDWRTPANILEKIIQYEAVHEINGWDDLRRRVDAADRRLYAFFHPALAEEPLVFVEVALTESMPDAIGPVLSGERRVLSPGDATVAAFYAISNCQAGLRGVSFGSFLIKQVVAELNRELPHLKEFATLSPVPGLRRWLQEEGIAADVADRGDRLVELTATYLAHARRPSGEPLDPVARFHLGNGARVERINLRADLSQRGLAQSWGAMVNYLYDPAAIERNHEAYANRREVVTGPAVKRLLRRGGRARHREPDHV